MKKLFHLPLIGFLLLALSLTSCKEKTAEVTTEKEKRVQIEMRTNKGDIVFELYNETPLHRDNFVKLTNEKYFDSLLFHRVINHFMIQTGDPYSKTASQTDTLGNGGLDYKVDAEFNPQLFHKKGALGAARDGNKQRASSSTQFYFAQGKVQNDSLLAVAENRINNWLASHVASNAIENEALLEAIQTASKNSDFDRYKILNDSLIKLGKLHENFTAYTIPEAHRAVYKKIGGTPHLDQNYTVFGEIISGIAVMDSIAATPTGNFDRPIEDVRILSVRVLN